MERNEDRHIEINVPVLARVEGEGALDLKIRGGAIEHLKLHIYEPPRLFEKLLEGRDLHEVPDIVARICGICPIAYQMSAVHALESMLAIDPGPWVRDMRRVIYCGEWLESHGLHIHLLALPDFLGYASAPAMAKDYPRRGAPRPAPAGAGQPAHQAVRRPLRASGGGAGGGLSPRPAAGGGDRHGGPSCARPWTTPRPWCAGSPPWTSPIMSSTSPVSACATPRSTP